MFENFAHLLGGFEVAFSFANISAAIFGGAIGLIVGAVPGLGSMSGVALLLPLTFKMSPTTGIIMLAAIYYANMYGGAFSAILLNIPGDSPAIMTALDGYPMSVQGKAGKALFTANISSFVGSAVGAVLLTFVGPGLAAVGLKFGPTEIAALILLALTSIGWLLGSSVLKGLVATGIGILLCTVGVDTALGTPRFTGGFVNLLSGIQFVPLVIGIFGFGQVMAMMVTKDDTQFICNTQKLTFRESILNWGEVKALIPTWIRSSFIGNFVGCLPGAGATTAGFLCYMAEKKLGKNTENMGKGAPQGVAASEAGNNSASAGALAPLLSLGIPGSGTAAIMLGGLMMWGLQPGPMLFTEHADFTWGLIASMYLGNLICLIVSMALIPVLMNVLNIPVRIMIPVVSAICVIGAYSVNNSMFDVYVMLIAGVAGYYLSINNYSISPLILAFVLAPRFEKAIRQSFEISRGSVGIFFQSPITVGLLLATAAFVLIPVIVKSVRGVKAKKAKNNPAS